MILSSITPRDDRYLDSEVRAVNKEVHNHISNNQSVIYVDNSNLSVNHYYYDYKHLCKKNGVSKFARNIKRGIRVACGIKLRERRSHPCSNNLRDNPSSSPIVNIASRPHHDLSPSKRKKIKLSMETNRLKKLEVALSLIS